MAGKKQNQTLGMGNRIWTEETLAIVKRYWGKEPPWQIAERINRLLEERQRARAKGRCPRCGSGQIYRRKRMSPPWKCFNVGCGHEFHDDEKLPPRILGLRTGDQGIGVITAAASLGLISEDEAVRLARSNTRRWEAAVGRAPVSPEKLRRQMLERDGYHCVRCGSTKDLEVDHIIPRAQSGPTQLSNLQTLCRRCHRLKASTARDPRYPAGRNEPYPCGSNKKFKHCCLPLLQPGARLTEHASLALSLVKGGGAVRHRFVLRRSGEEVGEVVLEDGSVDARLPEDVPADVREWIAAGHEEYVFGLVLTFDPEEMRRRRADPYYWLCVLRARVGPWWDEVVAEPELEWPTVPEGAIP